MGVVLSHRMDDRTERRIDYASRSFTVTGMPTTLTTVPAIDVCSLTIEQQVAQIKREALELYWRVKKFKDTYKNVHLYYKQTTSLLRFILDPGKAIPVTAEVPTTAMVFILGAFTCSIEHNTAIVMIYHVCHYR
jgi:hypothetical protein